MTQKGIMTIKAKILSGEIPGERIRENGRLVRTFRVEALTEDFRPLNMEIKGDTVDVPAPDTNVEVRGLVSVSEWKNALSGNEGEAIWMKNILSIKVLDESELSDSVFELRQIDNFQRVFNAESVVSVD
jgi:hypothetical protein